MHTVSRVPLSYPGSLMSQIPATVARAPVVTERELLHLKSLRGYTENEHDEIVNSFRKMAEELEISLQEYLEFMQQLASPL